MRRSAAIVIGLGSVALAAAAALFSAGTPGVAEVRASPHDRARIAFIREALGDVPADRVASRTIALTADGVFTHVRLTYGADSPSVAIAAVGANDRETHALAAKLPEGRDQTVLLPIARSRSWSPLAENVSVNVLHDALRPPLIREAALVRRNSAVLGDGVVWQFLEPEPFAMASANMLEGYGLAGMPFALLLGVIAVAASWIAWRRGGAGAAACALLACMGLYAARFVPDLLIATGREAYRWTIAGTLDETGDLHAMADSVTEMRKAEETVSTCENMSAPLSYFLGGVPVSEGPTGDIVAALIGWRASDGSIACADGVIRGPADAEFPLGGAILRRLPPARTP